MSTVALPARFARLVKLEHTLFALPFAYVGALLCVRRIPSAHDLVWITFAMVGARSLAKTPHGLLSRGVAGTIGTTLVVNLPGSTGGCRDGYAVLRPALPHALRLLAGEATAHQQT